MSEIEANMCGKRYVSNMADNIRKTSFKLGRSQNEFGLWIFGFATCQFSTLEKKDSVSKKWLDQDWIRGKI